ncbi:MAG: triose-phosphate isomerase [Lewinellaceae bacterium]|nr:triose-phosphate isomerase [Saprospiraceae bacterium]MCB9311571.1 triose-phosphate isomerase [Lewinellaceae bacterium]HRW76114.1 triose-phosphate isomerase [Saprospiraceae bacterium]
MARKRIVAGNWKMNMTIEEGRNWLRSFSRHHDLAQLVEEVIIFPPFTALAALANDEQGNLLQWGGQNLHEAGAGAYTGEISGPMIRDCHAGWVLVGHSERRTLFQEQDDLISRKMRRAIDSDLQPILCVGETLEERESGQFMEVVARQVVRGLADFPQHALDRLVIAYEPVWAIGTGKTASPQDAQDMHQHIRETLSRLYTQAVASSIRILYGGSVKPENAASLFACPDIDGGLVGGASLDPDQFAALLGIR